MLLLDLAAILKLKAVFSATKCLTPSPFTPCERGVDRAKELFLVTVIDKNCWQLQRCYQGPPPHSYLGDSPFQNPFTKTHLEFLLFVNCLSANALYDLMGGVLKHASCNSGFDVLLKYRQAHEQGTLLANCILLTAISGRPTV